MPVSEPATAAVEDSQRVPRPFPRMLRGARRELFARLVLNGALQGAAALALPFAVLRSPTLPMGEALVLLGLLAATLIILRVLELTDAERLGLDYVTEVRLALFDGLVNGTARSSHGVAMTRLMNDLSALKNWIGLGIARSVSAGLALTGCILAAAAFSPVHAMVILLPTILVALVAAFLVAPLRTRVAEVRRVRGKLASRLGEALLNLETLRSTGDAARSRRRVRRASRNLNAALGRCMGVAATLRALPDAILPCAVIAAVAAGLPLRADSIGLVILAGLAAGPVRQALRAVEYRAAFLVARERLAASLGRRKAGSSESRPQSTSPPSH